ncbi:hypothetical protein CQ014_07190 [Pseudomonas lurida]|nr:hypothetical protein CLM75_14405 [Pseudomonas lurida]PRA17630.1 hypothetical protein CQ002_07105 [Pseudomonas sp. MYb13]PRA20287.1 hypothetical protein CQ004_20035 [Pseudomonas lurida]PRA37496.1 hypothetical protein CQ005_05555 [Pseudomonas lurida]PRC02310.1 hypothetical protein CQ014_07190 [Pseudomonas lurida]
MAVQFSVRYKSGAEILFTHRPVAMPGPANIRRAFEEFLKTGKQSNWTYNFRDRTDDTVNTNIDYTIDFKDITSITEKELL